MDDAEPARFVDARWAQGVQVGNNNVQNNTFTILPAARSAYHSQIRFIAPALLHGREAELAELETFCVEPAARPYVWWQAAAWAGKSALMAWFTLNPPVGTRVVSFFVTARLADQDNRDAFLDAVLEQLAEVLDEPLSPALPPTQRAAHFLRMLEAATARCATLGQRLVLLVDGLDEDRGTDVQSIAALLPPRLADGLRVIVSSRPDPPLPTAVPTDHPLHNPQIVRVLAPSPHAQVIRNDAERDLKRLLTGTPLEQDLLGLVVAAGGGLSSRDMSELAGILQWEVDDTLKTVAGRAFAGRLPAGWTEKQPRYKVYILAHQDLQQAALTFLGESRLASYRETVVCWAQSYRERQWPPETPEYLLRGYLRMLDVANDTSGMVQLALDDRRQDRMRNVLGSDSAAMAELETAQDAVLRTPDPDTGSMLALAVRQDVLKRRNENLPVNLPVLWAMMGESARAEALIRSMSDSVKRLAAMAPIIPVLISLGETAAARRLADELVLGVKARLGNDHPRWDTEVTALCDAELLDYAEHLVRAFKAGEWQRPNYTRVACALAVRGLTLRAEALILDRVSGYGRELSFRAVVRSLAEAGDLVAAGELIRRQVFGDQQRGQALLEVVEACTRTGRAQQAEDLARQQALGQWRTWMIAETARGWAREGSPERAFEILGQAGDEQLEARTLPTIVQSWIERGETDRACGVALTIPSPFSRALALTDVACSWAMNGCLERAQAATSCAQDAAEDVDNLRMRDQALVQVMRAWVVSDSPDRADEMCKRTNLPHSLVQQSTAWALAAKGRVEPALAAVAEISEPAAHQMGLLEAVRGLIAAGEGERADIVARTMQPGRHQVQAFADLVRADTPNAKWPPSLSKELEDCFRQIPGRPTYEPHVTALATVAAHAASAGQQERAGTLAEMAASVIRESSPAAGRPAMYAGLAITLWKAGLHELAAALAVDAERTARSAVNGVWAVSSLIAIADGLSRAAMPDIVEAVLMEAESTAQIIFDTAQRYYAEQKVAQAWIACGRYDRAEAIAVRISTLGDINLSTSSELGALHIRTLIRAINGEVAAIIGEIRQMNLLNGAGGLLLVIAEDLARAGLYDEAKALTHHLWDHAEDDLNKHNYESYLPRIVDILIIAGEPAEAKMVARYEEQWVRANALRYQLGPQPARMANVASTLARSGELAKAEALQREFLGERNRQATPRERLRQAEVTARLAMEYARAGAEDVACQMVDLAESEMREVTETLAPTCDGIIAVARTLAIRGEVARAEDFIHECADEESKCWAFIELVRHATGQQMSHFMVKALRIHDWRSAVAEFSTRFPKRFAEVAPSIITELCRASGSLGWADGINASSPTHLHMEPVADERAGREHRCYPVLTFRSVASGPLRSRPSDKPIR